jgi:hypothetical protein
MRVGAECKKVSETRNGLCVRCTCSAHDYGENVDNGTMPVPSNGIG